MNENNKGFESGKGLKELGIDITKKFEVINNYNNGYFEVGEILKYINNNEYENDIINIFENESGEVHPVYWSRLKYADESNNHIGDINKSHLEFTTGTISNKSLSTLSEDRVKEIVSEQLKDSKENNTLINNKQTMNTITTEHNKILSEEYFSNENNLKKIREVNKSGLELIAGLSKARKDIQNKEYNIESLVTAIDEAYQSKDVKAMKELLKDFKAVKEFINNYSKSTISSLAKEDKEEYEFDVEEYFSSNF